MTTKPTFTVWITKYALTQGVHAVEAKESDSDKCIVVLNKDGTVNTVYMSPDWHRTEEEAKKQVRKMIKAKIASLEKATKKMKELEKKYSD